MRYAFLRQLWLNISVGFMGNIQIRLNEIFRKLQCSKYVIYLRQNNRLEQFHLAINYSKRTRKIRHKKKTVFITCMIIMNHNNTYFLNDHGACFSINIV